MAVAVVRRRSRLLSSGTCSVQHGRSVGDAQLVVGRTRHSGVQGNRDTLECEAIEAGGKQLPTP